MDPEVPEDDEISFQLITNVLGYRTKEDETTTNENYLGSGSRNTLVVRSDDANTGSKTYSRQGFTLFGAEDQDDRTPPKSQHNWLNNTGEEILLREANGVLEFYSEEVDAFVTLMEGLSTTLPVRFAEIWNTTELIDELLFVNHSPNVYEWSGGMATLLAVTAGTITINEQIGESRFLSTGTRSIRLLDATGVWRETAYTAQAGNSFTVSSDLTAFTFNPNTLVVQSVRTNANVIAAAYIIDTIDALDNQVYYGSETSRDHYITKNTSFIDVSFSSPRLPGEGAKTTLDDVNIGFKVGRNADGVEVMNIFAGQDFAYSLEFILSSGSTSDRETLKIRPLIFSPRQGARSQELIGKTKNDVIFVNWENELVELGQVDNYLTQEAKPISDPIKGDFANADFSNGGHVVLAKHNICVAVRADGICFFFDLQNKFWQPPQEIPIGLFSTYGTDLLGHSGSIKETYTLFDGLSDRAVGDGDGQPFTAIARFVYRNHGERFKLKNFDRYAHEIFMTSNLEMTHTTRFDYGGSRGIQEKMMSGADRDFLFTPPNNAALGVNSLGVPPLARSLASTPDFSKYRRIRPHAPVDYFEFQSEFSADILDSQFQIVAHGPNAQVSGNDPVKITG